MANLQNPPYQDPSDSQRWADYFRNINETLSDVSTTITSIDDVNIVGAATDDFFVFTDESEWENVEAAAVVEILGLDTADAVVFDTLDVETLTAEDIEGATALWTGNVDIEGTLTGPTTIGGTDVEFATGLFTGNLDVEGVLSGPTDIEATDIEIASGLVTGNFDIEGDLLVGSGGILDVEDGLITDENSNVTIGAPTLATNATDGFAYIPVTEGTPTGTPTTKTGFVPMVYDDVNDLLYIYNGSWVNTVFT